MNKIRPVILAGGSGSRLWPLSRSRYPKQFLALNSDETLLQSTLGRAKFCSSIPALVVCNEEHRFLAAEQIRDFGAQDIDILLEPCARNTAPAIAAAAWKIHADDPEALMLVMPADHLIGDQQRFAQIINAASESAIKGQLVTFGIKPSYAATGYGYIHADSTVTDGVQTITAFIEKPDSETAEKYITDGGYYWNSGIFLFRADVFLEILRSLEPEMYARSKTSVDKAKSDLDFLRLDETEFSQCPSISIDYAVMEKASERSVMPFDVEWSDIGSWNALHEATDKDSNGNVVRGDTVVVGSKNCLIHAETRLVSAVGLDNIGVIETADSILVTNLNDSENVKTIVEKLNSEDRPETDLHRIVYRPWGSYESIAMGDRFQVKRIVVKPGAALSLQKHHHRSEHWVVAYGTAVVTIDEKVVQLSENQSTYIPLGAVHRLENPGKIPLILIEVQSGSYLGEDDIVRLEDVYGRG